MAGREVAVELNDRGRLLVGNRLGEAVLRVDGRVVSSTESDVTLSVTRTVLLQGSSVVWMGEEVSIPREGLRGFRVREFSRARTIFFTAGIVLLVGAVVAGFGIIGVLGLGPDDDGQCSTDCNQQ